MKRHRPLLAARLQHLPFIMKPCTGRRGRDPTGDPR
jgi:hypothetical protein